MYLNKISIINFKNISESEMRLGEGINCFIGSNGAGKSNALDAVNYLCVCKSAFAMSDSQSIRHDEEFFLVDGTFTCANQKSERISCSYTRKTGKILKRNGKEYDKLSEHIGLIPIVMISPADYSLVSDSADERRRFLNTFISQIDRDYLSALVKYNALLSERNRYLKMSPSEEMLEVYDSQMSTYATILNRKRTEITALLQPLIERNYALIADGAEQISIEYKSEVSQMPLGDILRANRSRDIAMQFTTAGIHRDDVVFKIASYPLRKFGSQGQQKSFLIALKLAQYTIVAQQKGECPILLLDDIFDKLDAGRVAKLIEIVASPDFGQVLITDCNPRRLSQIMEQSATQYELFDVSDGSVTQQDR